MRSSGRSVPKSYLGSMALSSLTSRSAVSEAEIGMRNSSSADLADLGTSLSVTPGATSALRRSRIIAAAPAAAEAASFSGSDKCFSTSRAVKARRAAAAFSSSQAIIEKSARSIISCRQVPACAPLGKDRMSSTSGGFSACPYQVENPGPSSSAIRVMPVKLEVRHSLRRVCDRAVV